jgi:hypothetical protein
MFNKPTSAWFYCTFPLQKVEIEKILFDLLRPRQSRKAQKVQSLSRAVSQKNLRQFYHHFSKIWEQLCQNSRDMNQPAEV